MTILGGVSDAAFTVALESPAWTVTAQIRLSSDVRGASVRIARRDRLKAMLIISGYSALHVVEACSGIDYVNSVYNPSSE